MARDIYATKRTLNIRCKYYKVDKTIKDKTKLEHEKNVCGVFYCKMVSPKTLQYSNLSDVFRINSSSTTIEIHDDVKLLNIDDKVIFDNGDEWLVENKQENISYKQQEFSRNAKAITYIQLVK